MPPGPRAVPPPAPPPAAAASGRTGRPGCGSSEESRLDSRALGRRKRGRRRETKDTKQCVFHLTSINSCRTIDERLRAETILFFQGQHLSVCTSVMRSVWACE